MLYVAAALVASAVLVWTPWQSPAAAPDLEAQIRALQHEVLRNTITLSYICDDLKRPPRARVLPDHSGPLAAWMQRLARDCAGR